VAAKITKELGDRKRRREGEKVAVEKLAQERLAAHRLNA
jgi:hypothetical protein